MTLYEITATHKKNDMCVSMFYESIQEAEKHNPSFKNFRIVREITKK